LKSDPPRRVALAWRRAGRFSAQPPLSALAKLGIEPIAERVSPHSLRRTCASLRSALRDDPFYIAEQLGHTNLAFTFRVYHRAAKRREKLSGAYLKAFDAALDWALMGTSAEIPDADAQEREEHDSAQPA
jgi:integrase